MGVRMPRIVATAPEVEHKPYRPWIAVQVIIVAVLLGGLLGTTYAGLGNRSSLASYEYALWRWQAENIPSVLLRLAGIDPPMDGLSDTEVLQRYFAYTTQMRNEANKLEPDRERLSDLRIARDHYERRTERVLMEYIDDAIGQAGLRETLPFFRDVSFTWPPVEIRLAEPPHVLVRSPRDDIVRLGDRLLRTNLTLDDIDHVETKVDGDDLASMVIPLGGLATYPAIVTSNRNYWGILETAAHEWIHHYLAFYPLGQTWGSSHEANVLNETVANVGGRGIASIVHQRNPVSFADGRDGSWTARPERTVEFNETMRELRLEVDDLLEEGRVQEAERLMEETRLFLAEHGIVIRRLNQAYFAFFGTYADLPASSDPIGPKVEQLWELAGHDLALFMELVRDITNVDELRETLDWMERLQVASGG